MDALKRTKIMKRVDVRFGGEGHCERNNGNYDGGGEVAVSGHLYRAKLMLLKTKSSFRLTFSLVFYLIFLSMIKLRIMVLVTR